MANKSLVFTIQARDNDALSAFRRIGMEAKKSMKQAADALTDTRTAGQKMADALGLVAEDLKTELAQAASASKALGAALGADFDRGAGAVDGFVADLRRAGLTFEEIEADADSLAASIRKLDDVSVRPVATGMDDVAVSSRKAGVEMDKSRSVLANFAGNAAQDLPGISGAFGALNVAAGQFAEYAAEGDIKMGGLAKSLIPIAAGTVAVGLLANHMKNIAETKAFNADRVKTFVDYLRQGQTIAEGLAGDIRETGEVLARWGAMSKSQDLVDEFARLGITIGDYTSIIGKSSDEIEAWGVRHMGVTVDAAKQERSLLKSRGALNDSDRARLAVLDDIIKVYRGVEQETRNAAQAQKDLNEQHAAGIYTTEEIVNLGGQYREMLEGVNRALIEQSGAIPVVAAALGGAATKAKGWLGGWKSAADAAADEVEEMERRITAALDRMAGRLSDEATLDTLDDQFADVKAKGVAAMQALASGAADAAQKNEDYQDSVRELKQTVVSELSGLRQRYKDAIPETVYTNVETLINQGKLDHARAILDSLARTRSVSYEPQIDYSKLTAGVRAEGGPVRAGLTYLVGEKGPELFTAPASGTIIPNRALSAPTVIPAPAMAMAGGGGTTVVVNNYIGGSVVTERQLVDAVHEGLLRKSRSSGSLGLN